MDGVCRARGCIILRVLPCSQVETRSSMFSQMSGKHPSSFDILLHAGHRSAGTVLISPLSAHPYTAG